MQYDPTKPYKSQLLKAIELTWDSPYSHITRWPNQPYPIIRRLHNCFVEVDHTDGIGTKGLIHAMCRSWAEAAQDALAMNLNDLLAMRATPYKLQNHLTFATDDHEAIIAVVEELATLCRKYKIAMTGGETSIMDTVQGMDLSVTVTGFVQSLKGSLLQTGDLLVGLPSNGVHSNGFTTVRRYIAGAALRELVAPTTIYWDKVWPHLDNIEACMHIAGGGLSRIRDYMQHNQCVQINRYKNRHPIFDNIYQYSKCSIEGCLTDEQMYTTFNCGMGMILSIAPDKAESIASQLGGEIIGEVVEGKKNKIIVESIFSDKVLDI